MAWQPLLGIGRRPPTSLATAFSLAEGIQVAPWVRKAFLVAFMGLWMASCESSPQPAWAVESHEIPASVVADAIYRAEGGAKTRHPYGVLSVKVGSTAEARQVCLNSIRNSRQRWEKAGRPGDWLEFFQKRWCPVGASNDPAGLNHNWLRNVRGILKDSLT